METCCPKISVTALIQRASDLACACRRDKKELCGAGLDWKQVELLAGMTVQCSEKEAECGLQKEKNARETARLNAYVRSCALFRREVAESARAAFFRAGSDIRVPSIRGARSRAELVQDLSDIAVFCRMHGEGLAKGGFDPLLAEKAARTAQELSESLAGAVLRRTMPSGPVVQRNRTCRELYETAMEICRTGRMVFRNDRLRRKDYRSVQLP